MEHNWVYPREKVPEQKSEMDPRNASSFDPSSDVKGQGYECYTSVEEQVNQGQKRIGFRRLVFTMQVDIPEDLDIYPEIHWKVIPRNKHIPAPAEVPSNESSEVIGGYLDEPTNENAAADVERSKFKNNSSENNSEITEGLEKDCDETSENFLKNIWSSFTENENSGISIGEPTKQDGDLQQHFQTDYNCNVDTADRKKCHINSQENSSHVTMVTSENLSQIGDQKSQNDEQFINSLTDNSGTYIYTSGGSSFLVQGSKVKENPRHQNSEMVPSQSCVNRTDFANIIGSDYFEAAANQPWSAPPMGRNSNLIGNNEILNDDQWSMSFNQPNIKHEESDNKNILPLDSSCGAGFSENYRNSENINGYHDNINGYPDNINGYHDNINGVELSNTVAPFGLSESCPSQTQMQNQEHFYNRVENKSENVSDFIFDNDETNNFTDIEDGTNIHGVGDDEDIHDDVEDDDDDSDDDNDDLNWKPNYCYTKAVAQFDTEDISLSTILESVADYEGFQIHEVPADGNCMFAAVLDQLQIGGNLDFSVKSLRKAAVSNLRDNPYQEDGTHLESFLQTDTWESYLSRMAANTVWGDHLILKSLTELFGCRIVIFTANPDSQSKTILDPAHMNVNPLETLYLGHIGDCHFNSLRPKHWEDDWPARAKIYKEKRNVKTWLISILKQEVENASTAKDYGYMCMKNEPVKGFNSAEDRDDKEEVTALKDYGNAELKQEVKIDMDSGNSEMNDELEKDKVAVRETLLKILEEVCEDNEIERNYEMLKSIQKYKDTDIDGQHLKDSTAVDPVSKIPLPHWNFLLLNILQSHEIRLQFRSHVNRLCSFHSFIEFIGSQEEGLSYYLSNYSTTRSKTDQEKVVRAVVLMPKGKVCYNVDPHNQLETDVVAVMESCHPGYLRLRPVDTQQWKKFVDGEYLSHKHFKIPESKTGEQNKENKIWCGVSCPEWPESTLEWVCRDRPSDWPQPQLMERLMNYGCSVVSKPHPQSSDPDKEWMFLFSKAEKALASEALNSDMKYCFGIFKVLIDHQTGSIKPKLSTNFLKHVMFYACEVISPSCWSDNVGGCVLYLLQQLLIGLKIRNIPNYFIRENNMIDHFPEDSIKQHIKKVEILRIFPVTSLKFLADHHGLTKSWITKKVVSDVDKYTQDKNIHRTLYKCFVPTTLSLAKKNVECNQHSKAMECLELLYEKVYLLHQQNVLDYPEFLEKVLSQEKDENFLFWIGFHIELELEISLLPNLLKNMHTVTIGDIVGQGDSGKFSSTPVPKSLLNYVSFREIYFLDNFTKYLIRYKNEHCTHYINQNILKIKAAMLETTDISQVTDVKVRGQIGSENYTRVWSLNKLLFSNLYNLMHQYHLQGKKEMIKKHKEEFEECCKKLDNSTAYRQLSRVWDWMEAENDSRMANQRGGHGGNRWDTTLSRNVGDVPQGASTEDNGDNTGLSVLILSLTKMISRNSETTEQDYNSLD